MKRSELVSIAHALRSEGAEIAEIAEIMGKAYQTVCGYFHDPDLARQRARRARYAGTCLDCGKKTDGSNGRDKAPFYCDACTRKHRVYWTRERVIEAFHAWYARYGEPPSAYDWNPGDKRFDGRQRRQYRFYSGRYPHAATVLNLFGSWNAGVIAAGFMPLKVGGKKHQRAAA